MRWVWARPAPTIRFAHGVVVRLPGLLGGAVTDHPRVLDERDVLRPASMPVRS